MRALFIDVQRPITSRLVDGVNKENLGEGVKTLGARFFKPMREFGIQSWDTLLRQQIEVIRNEIHANRSTGVVWLDGDQYSDIQEPIFIGDGDGVRTEFPLPFNDVFPSSWKIWDSQTLKTDWTMYPSSGTIIFTAAPTGRLTGLGKRKFRCIIQDNNDSILNETQLYANQDAVGVYSTEPITFLEVEGVDVS